MGGEIKSISVDESVVNGDGCKRDSSKLFNVLYRKRAKEHADIQRVFMMQHTLKNYETLFNETFLKPPVWQPVIDCMTEQINHNVKIVNELKDECKNIELNLHIIENQLNGTVGPDDQLQQLMEIIGNN